MVFPLLARVYGSKSIKPRLLQNGISTSQLTLVNSVVYDTSYKIPNSMQIV